jgi:hypothetical protein
MTTNELIARLREEDPEGNTQVVVGNTPIYTVESLPAYYDGCMQVLIQDHSKDPYYNITGIRFQSDGRKVSLGRMDWEDVLWNNPQAEIDLSGLGTGLVHDVTARKVEDTRKEVIRELASIHADKHKGLLPVFDEDPNKE